ncbi:Grancalcin, partial [Plecturocebus cupreus]
MAASFQYRSHINGEGDLDLTGSKFTEHLLKGQEWSLALLPRLECSVWHVLCLCSLCLLGSTTLTRSVTLAALVMAYPGYGGEVSPSRLAVSLSLAGCGAPGGGASLRVRPRLLLPASVPGTQQRRYSGDVGNQGRASVDPGMTWSSGVLEVPRGASWWTRGSNFGNFNSQMPGAGPDVLLGGYSGYPAYSDPYSSADDTMYAYFSAVAGQ